MAAITSTDHKADSPASAPSPFPELSSLIAIFPKIVKPPSAEHLASDSHPETKGHEASKPPRFGGDEYKAMALVVQKDESTSEDADPDPKKWVPHIIRPGFQELPSNLSPAAEAYLQSITLSQEAESRHHLLKTFRAKDGKDVTTFPAVIVSPPSGPPPPMAMSIFNNAIGEVLGPLLVEDCLLDVTDNEYSVRAAADGALYSAETVTGAGDDVHLVILIGGDGVVSDFVSAYTDSPSVLEKTRDAAGNWRPMTRKEVHVAVVPAGTANALFHSVHAESKGRMEGVDPGRGAGGTEEEKKANLLALALRSMVFGRPVPIPTFKVMFPDGSREVTRSVEEPGVQGADLDPASLTPKIALSSKPTAHLNGAVVFSWCLHAALVADSDSPAYRKLGSSRFQRAAEANLVPAPYKYKGRVWILPDDGAQIQGGEENWVTLEQSEFTYLNALLVDRLEESFVISPRSKPLEQKMWLCWLKKRPGEEDKEWDKESIMMVMMKAYNGGKHVESPSVGYRPILGLRVEMEEEEQRYRRVCVDGRIFVVGGDEEGGSKTVEVRLNDAKKAEREGRQVKMLVF